MCFSAIAVVLSVFSFFSTNPETPAVLVVSESVEDFQVIADATGTDVETIIFDPAETSLDELLNRVENRLASRKASKIGFAVHDFGEAKFYLTDGETISLGSTLTRESQRQFWEDLGELVSSDGRIDIFACHLAETEKGKLLLSQIRKASGVEISASSDATGSAEQGGNWILEYGNINAETEYFGADKLRRFNGLLEVDQVKLLSPASVYEGHFGCSVAVDGDYAIVGADGEGSSMSDKGAAYIFHRIDANSWDDGVKILSSDIQDNDYFGYSVGISGDFAIVGAPFEDTGAEDAGAAYIFRRTGVNTWDSGTKIQAIDKSRVDKFGGSVSIDGEYAVVGAPTENDGDAGITAGAAYIFHCTDINNNTWDSGTKIQASAEDSMDYFGCSVAVDGDYAIVGARSDDDGAINAGAAYIFRRTGTNAWDDSTKIQASDLGSTDYFGVAVSISGNYAIVGASNDDTFDTNSGAAYIFNRTDTNTWSSGVKILADDGEFADGFGGSVSISVDLAVVGAPNEDTGASAAGAAYIFRRTGPNEWAKQEKFQALDRHNGDHFGNSIAFSGSFAIVGAEDLELDGVDSNGAAYIFDFTPRNVEISGSTGGSTDPNGSNPVDFLDDITITPDPYDGFTFSGWSGDDTSSDNPLVFTSVVDHKSVTANFTRDKGNLEVTLDDTVSSNGTFSISGPADFGEQTGLTSFVSQPPVPTGNYTVTFESMTGYDIGVSSASFAVEGRVASGAIAKGGSISVSGVYSESQYNVHVGTAVGGSTNKDGDNPVGYDGEITITATQDVGYTFAGWSGDNGGDNSNPLTLTKIRNDKAVTPIFTRDQAQLQVNIKENSSGGSFNIYGPQDFDAIEDRKTDFDEPVPAGSYTVIFVNRAGYDCQIVVANKLAASEQTATGVLAAGDSGKVTGRYTQLDAVGTLTVNLKPNGVAGQWKLTDRDTWQNSSDQITIYHKNVTVEFKDAARWISPGQVDLSFSQDENKTIVKFYYSFYRTCACADYDGDGDCDPVTFDDLTNIWSARNISSQTMPEAQYMVPGDYDGDGSVDRAFYRPDTGLWNVIGIKKQKIGTAGDIPVPADYDGDGKTDIAVWRPGKGLWIIIKSDGTGNIRRVYGKSTDVPAPADYNGNGTDDIAFYRPSNSTFFVKGQFKLRRGAEGDIPCVADYDGNGTADIVVYRPSHHRFLARGLSWDSISYGQAGDVPVCADYNGDGKADLALWRPTTGQWLVKGIMILTHGEEGDLPLVNGK